MSTGTMKTVKAGKTENEFEDRHITLRGVDYTIKELDVVQYKECLKSATDAEGFTPFQTLLDNMVMRCVSPSPAARSKPMPYPVYRTLEDIVNVMHFITLEDENKPPEEEKTEGDGEAEAEPDPNS